MRFRLLTCALVVSATSAAIACGGSEPPAQSPTAPASATTLTNGPTPSSDPVVAPSPSGPLLGNPAPDPVASSPSVTPADTSVAANPGAREQTPAVDNTKINDRDRHRTLTPLDQGNSRSETKITAAIRKDLMSDKSLSFTAKNVKVITVGTKVILRGSVKSDDERAAIEAHAKQAPGVTDVDNELEVKK